MRPLLFLTLVIAAAGFRTTTLPTQPKSHARTLRPQMIDNSFLVGGGVLLLGLGGGVGLIALTEQAGKRNEAKVNAQPCVVCKGEQIVTCTICQGTGEDPYASLVAGVKAEIGEEGETGKVVVEDWASGPKEVVMYEEILSRYPVKATENVCQNCAGRGVVVCDNCQGTGLQPRFLERYSPDDFMD